jgi:hypothetical protein
MAKAEGLARLAALAGNLQNADGAASNLADRLEAAVESLGVEMPITTGIIETVEATRDALRTINQAMLPGDNGGPAVPLPGSPAPPAPSPAAMVPVALKTAPAASPVPDAATEEPHFERTALGMVRR